MKKAVYRVFLGVLLLFFFAALLELALGVFFSFKDGQYPIFEVRDSPYLYYLPTEGDQSNQYGFKTQYSKEKPDDVYRIILVGGSVARGKLPEESIAHFLEKELSGFLDKKVQVINAGVSGFVVQQEFILIQTILQDYDPDMIVGLDGYNDLMSYKLNRMYDTDHLLPPHNWSDFQVIRYLKFREKPYSRFAFPFKNLNRLKEYLIRKKFESQFDWNEISEEDLLPVVRAYGKILLDSRDFCAAKNIRYFNFLQPIKYYSRVKVGEELVPEKETLSKLYAAFEGVYAQLPFTFSVTPVFDQNLGLFTDECHTNAEGNQLIAKEMGVTLGALLKIDARNKNRVD